jgi:putative SOS response-associated peptidase YedK
VDAFESASAEVAAYLDVETGEVVWITAEARRELERAFRRFKSVLAAHPTERERWFAFQDARVLERVHEWLADEGIEPISEPD